MKYIDLLHFIIICYGHSCSGAGQTFHLYEEDTDVLLEVQGAHKTWSEAQNECLERNGTLVEIINKATRVKLENVTKNITDMHGNDFWIGLKKRDVWNWAAGDCNMSYTAWAKGAPSDGDRNKNHAVLWYDQTGRTDPSHSYKWRDVSGKSNMITNAPTKYICQSKSTCAVLTKCFADHNRCSYIRGYCFFFGGNELPESVDGMTWSGAYAKCKNIDDCGFTAKCTSKSYHPWTLACIQNKDIQNGLTKFLQSNNVYHGNYWISAKKSNTYEWKWESGKRMEWANWDSGQPSGSANESCIEMRSLSYKWYNMRCEEKKPFICQYDNFSSWSTWSSWSSCNNTCGTGVRTRNRTCVIFGKSPKRLTCASGERNVQNDSKYCHKSACTVNGRWSAWGTWSDCSKTCGRGLKTRWRQCNNPAPSGGGKYCSGKNISSETCRLKDCPVNGYWSSWTDWSDCSVSCGIGVRERTRQCDSPIPQNGGLYCQGENTSTARCGGITCADEWSLYISASSKNIASIDLINPSTPSMNSQILSPTSRDKSITYFSTQIPSTSIFVYENRPTSETFTAVTYERQKSDDASKALVATLSSGSDTLYEIMTSTASSLFDAKVDGQNILTQQKSASPNRHTIVSVDLIDGHTTVFGSLVSKNDFVASTSSVYSHLSSELEVTATSEVEEKTSILTETGNQLLPSDNTIQLTETISKYEIEFHENGSDTDNTPSLNFYTLFSSKQNENNSLFGSTGVHISSSASELLDSMYSTRDQGGGHISSVATLGDGPSSIYSPTPVTMHIDMREYSLSTISKDQLSTSSAIYVSNTIDLLHDSALGTMVPSTINPLTGSYGGVTPTALPGDSELSSSALVPSLHTTSHRFDKNSNHGITMMQHMTKSSLDYPKLQTSRHTQPSSGNVVDYYEHVTYTPLVDTMSEVIDTNTILKGSISSVYRNSVLDVITFESLFEQESEFNHRVKQTDLLISTNSEVIGNIITNCVGVSLKQMPPTKVKSHGSPITERRISSITSLSSMLNTILQPPETGEIIEPSKETESFGMRTGVLDNKSEANVMLSYPGVDLASLTTPVVTDSPSLVRAETSYISISMQQSKKEAKETSSVISPTKVWDESTHLGNGPFSSHSALGTFDTTTTKASTVSDINMDTSSGTLTSYSSISIQENKNETEVTPSLISPTKVWDESIHLGTDPFSSNFALGTFDTTATKASVVSDINVDTSSGILTTTQSTEKSSKYPVYQWALIGLSGILVPVLIVVGTFVYCCKRYCRNRGKEEVTDTGVTHASQVWYDNVMYESNTESIHQPGHRISRLEIIHNQRIQSMVLRKDQLLHKEDQNSSQQQVSHSPQRSDPQKNLKQKSLSVIMDQHYKSDRENSERRLGSPLSRKRYSEIQYPMSFHESKSAAPPRRPQTMIQLPYKYSRTRRVETLYIEEEGGILLPYGDVEGCDPIPDYDDIRVIPQPDY